MFFPRPSMANWNHVIKTSSAILPVMYDSTNRMKLILSSTGNCVSPVNLFSAANSLEDIEAARMEGVPASVYVAARTFTSQTKSFFGSRQETIDRLADHRTISLQNRILKKYPSNLNTDLFNVIINETVFILPMSNLSEIISKEPNDFLQKKIHGAKNTQGIKCLSWVEVKEALLRRKKELELGLLQAEAEDARLLPRDVRYIRLENTSILVLSENLSYFLFENMHVLDSLDEKMPSLHRILCKEERRRQEKQAEKNHKIYACAILAIYCSGIGLFIKITNSGKREGIRRQMDQKDLLMIPT